VPSELIAPHANTPKEENRLKAKAIRDEYEATKRASGAPATANRTMSSSTANDDISTAGRKRTHGAISTASVPETYRDARNGSTPGQPGYSKPRDDNVLQPAKKFAKYVDYDLSKMTDTKGGFMTAEDDPHNKALHSTKDGEKPAHMTLKEWERLQLMKSLRMRKEGPFEPGLSSLERDRTKKCRECGSLEVDWSWEDIFKTLVCHSCKDKFPEKYSLLTKTEAKDDYLLTDREFCPSMGAGNLLTSCS
jgi:DNA-repair protein complementing XP-A cells